VKATPLSHDRVPAVGVYDWMTVSFTGLVLMKIVQDTGVDFLECPLN